MEAMRKKATAYKNKLCACGERETRYMQSRPTLPSLLNGPFLSLHAWTWDFCWLPMCLVLISLIGLQTLQKQSV